MVISLTLLFLCSLILSFFEDRLSKRDSIILYVLLGVCLVLVAGLRAVGSTPDSDVYEDIYYGKINILLEKTMEPSFTFISFILTSLSLGVNALFLTYAAISIALHLTVFRKFSQLPFLTLTIYISYYYMMHDLVQIRAGVAAGFLLWAIYYYVEQKKKYAALFIVFATLFHFSAAAGFILFLFTNKLPRWQKIILLSIIPIGLIVYFTQLDISRLVPEEFGGTKLMAYRELRDKGLEDEQAGWPLEINIVIWMNIVLYCACIIYNDYLTKFCKYVPIAIKMQAFAFFCLLFLNGVSKVLGNRMCDFYSISTIILWTASFYAFYPRVVSLTISHSISTLRFVASAVAYALALLWT